MIATNLLFATNTLSTLLGRTMQSWFWKPLLNPPPLVVSCYIGCFLTCFSSVMSVIFLVALLTRIVISAMTGLWYFPLCFWFWCSSLFKSLHNSWDCCLLVLNHRHTQQFPLVKFSLLHCGCGLELFFFLKTRIGCSKPGDCDNSSSCCCIWSSSSSEHHSRPYIHKWVVENVDCEGRIKAHKS